MATQSETRGSRPGSGGKGERHRPWPRAVGFTLVDRKVLLKALLPPIHTPRNQSSEALWQQLTDYGERFTFRLNDCRY